MAKNRKNQAAEIRFGPVLKVVLLCGLIGGSAIGFVWQKSQIAYLGRQIREHETKLEQMRKDNKVLADQVAFLKSPIMIDRRVRDLNLGLAPAQPLQVVRLAEPKPMPLVDDDNDVPREYAQRPASGGARRQ